MRVITTAHAKGYLQYGQAWLDGRKHWPKGTEFYWYTEGYELPYQPDELEAIERLGLGPNDALIERIDLNTLTYFAEWKEKHKTAEKKEWKFDVVKYAHKMFAMIEGTKNYKGIAVWLDADCETYRDIPEGLVESMVKDAYIAHYWRPGRWTETGCWIVDCSHPGHREFMEFLSWVYLTDRFKKLYHWTDCYVLDNAIHKFTTRGTIRARDMSPAEGELNGHPMSFSELGRYIDHKKGWRKEIESSPENAFRNECLPGVRPYAPAI